MDTHAGKILCEVEERDQDDAAETNECQRCQETTRNWGGTQDTFPSLTSEGNQPC